MTQFVKLIRRIGIKNITVSGIKNERILAYTLRIKILINDFILLLQYINKV